MKQVLGFGLLIMPSVCWAVEENQARNETLYIQTDKLATPSEAQKEKIPFFAEPTAANEMMEEVEDLKKEVDVLKVRVDQLEKKSVKE